MSHRGSSQAGDDAQGLASCPHAFEPTGFGYLLGPPKPEQRSRLGENPAEAHRLLSALAQALPPPERYWPTSLQDGVERDDNPFIPSGYTYLLQLVAHDAVQTSVPFWAAAPLGLGSRNLRSSPLLLDTLYGGGPGAAPVAYRGAGDSTTDRTLLRVGRLNGPAKPGGCLFHDLARINFGGSNLEIANFADPYITCVADARNDDNLVLAQLVALFASAHNAIVGQLLGGRPEAVFGYAQAAMQCIYHAIVEHDLLPRLLHPEVSRALRERSANDECWLWRTDAVPLEFTHGAFRIGHAMVRQDYSFNASTDALQIGTVLDGDKFQGETRVPVRQSWIIDWARFFDMSPDVPLNLSRRFSPTKSVLDAPGLFKSNDKSQPATLGLRDLLSAAHARTWRVDALLDRILAHNSNPIPPTWPWRDAEVRRAAIHDWLSSRCDKLDKTDIDTIADDPPLPLFVLLESALDSHISGRHLGPLGSTIVGEVIGRSISRQRRQLKATVDAAKATFAPACWEEMTAITSMSALIGFARRHSGCSTPA